ncbi:hypothetical protein AX16_001491 [Volvariella volvacea WC 439]|nr:hypothetical protein AX16_001491 [Volvariella volvacea WC 439]
METLLGFLVLSLLFLSYRRRRLSLPPGPKGRPLIGNVGDLPKSHEWRTYEKWARKYNSDVLYLNLAGKSLIILNTLAAAKELLERRSTLYSSRPRMMMLELMGWDYIFVLMKYGATWRQHRRFMHQSCNSNAVKRFKPHITKSTHTLMQNLLAKPGDFQRHIQHMASEIIILITYGVHINPVDDPIVRIAEKALATANEANIPGRFLVEALPWLKYVPEWMPFARFQRQAREWREHAISMREVPYHAVRDDVLSGTGIDSLVAEGLRAIKEGDDAQEKEDIVKKVAGTMFAAGVDTTVATILSGILALMLYPDVMKKAQREIDAVIKPGNCPEFSDKESLPYLSALVKELWRWSSVFPLGVPHVNEEEDTYRGYTIPANSIVLVNQWALLHDPAVYADPFAFNPERFFKDGKWNKSIQDPEEIAFGFGRRICPGRHFASLMVWMTMAHLIALFDISKPTDEDGGIIEQDCGWTSGAISHPLPFKCKIVPRSPEAIAAIENTRGLNYFY